MWGGHALIWYSCDNKCHIYWSLSPTYDEKYTTSLSYIISLVDSYVIALYELLGNSNTNSFVIWSLNKTLIY